MANLILNPHKEFILPQQNIGFQGYIGWELVRDGKVIRKSRLQKNLILDTGLNGLGSGISMQTFVTYAQVGTDATAPAAGQTGLIAPIAGRVSANGGIGDVTGVGGTYDYFYRRVTRLFVEAEGNGNLTEISFYNLSSGGTAFNRQRLLDDLGNPTTITKTVAEQLRITYEMRMYPNKTQLVQAAFNISGVSTTITSQVLNLAVGNWNQVNFGLWSLSSWQAFESATIPAVTAVPSGTSGGVTSATLQAYVANNFYREAVYVMDPAISNFATGIGAFAWGPSVGGGDYWFGHFFNPKVSKDNTKRFSLTTRIGWARHP